MARFRHSLFIFAAALDSFSCIAAVSLSGPACARRNYKRADCVSKCQSNWGFGNYVIGQEAWGPVMSTMNSNMNNIISEACGFSSSSGISSVSSTSSPVVETSFPIKLPPSSLFSSHPSTLTSISSFTAHSSFSSSVPETTSFSTPSSSISSPPSSFVAAKESLRSLSVVSSPSTTLIIPGPSTTSSFPQQSFSYKPVSDLPLDSMTSLYQSTSSSSYISVSSSPYPSSPLKAGTNKPALLPSLGYKKFPYPSASLSPSLTGSCSTSLPSQPVFGLLPSAGGSKASSSNPTSQFDINAYLSAHNSVRALHRAANMTWSDSAAAAAQKWASRCVFRHSDGSVGQFGENLAAGTSNYTIQDGIKAWTDEASQYNGNNPVPSHFTQVVWKATTAVGCALINCPAGSIFPANYGSSNYIVCEYSPQGNIIGEFSQNVEV